MDPYSVLGVPKKASEANVNAAHAALIGRLNPANPFDSYRLAVVEEAYRFLSQSAWARKQDERTRPTIAEFTVPDEPKWFTKVRKDLDNGSILNVTSDLPADRRKIITFLLAQERYRQDREDALKQLEEAFTKNADRFAEESKPTELQFLRENFGKRVDGLSQAYGLEKDDATDEYGKRLQTIFTDHASKLKSFDESWVNPAQRYVRKCGLAVREFEATMTAIDTRYHSELTSV